MATTTQIISENQILFTCISCSIAFESADEQRAHYRSDHHRYNMKRRVASLPPVSAETFNQKVLDRRAETAIMSSTKGSSCSICRKTYTTENAYRSHISSKRHKEAEEKYNETLKQQMSAKEEDTIPKTSTTPKLASNTTHTTPEALGELKDALEGLTIDQKIAAARTRLSPADCLFCPTSSASLAENLTHMSTNHGFFIPDADYLIDLPGLITYLGEKIAVGNVCIYCYARRRRNVSSGNATPESGDGGREFRSLEATRRHMVDKAHCKIAYESQEEQLEVSDYYDFTSSYPTAFKRPKAIKDEEWEDIEDGSEGTPDQEQDDAEDDESEDLDQIPDNEIRFGDTPYELVLPSGARIGHRSLRHYYKQNYRPSLYPKAANSEEDAKSGVALVRSLLAEKNSALVPRKGGFGAFGGGSEVIKARNPGEAKEAGRHIREFRDMQRREQFKTKIGYIGNHQKHFRDPLLQ